MLVGSLFSGVGGFDLAFERAGFEIAWQVEIDEFCAAVLAKHWPDVPRYGDVRECGAHNLAPVDCIIGGFPCQPHSVAGKRLGQADERHLWPEYGPGLRSTAADEVLGDLETAGYSCWPLVVGADDVGAPHRRKRVFIVARRLADAKPDAGLHIEPRHQGGATLFRQELTEASGWRLADAKHGRRGAGSEQAGRETGPETDGRGRERQLDDAAEAADASSRGQRVKRSSGEPGHGRHPDGGDESRRLAYAIEQGLEGAISAVVAGPGDGRQDGDAAGSTRWPARPGEHQQAWEPPRVLRRAESGVGRDIGRTTDRVDGRADAPQRSNRRARLAAIGNCVVPQVAELIARAIRRVEELDAKSLHENAVGVAGWQEG
jgi:DNA (cytosine-5)-methyltransferase 1